MSSIRIAASAGVLTLALGAGAWGSAYAFPLRADRVITPPQEPSAQAQSEKPPLTPSPVTISLKDAELPKVLKMFEMMTKMKVQFDPALRGSVTIDLVNEPWDKALGEILRLQGLAFDVKDGVIRIARSSAAMPPPPFPPSGGESSGIAGDSQMAFMPESFERRLKELNVVRIGGDVKVPAKIRDVRPVYPPSATSARVQGVVILEVLIDVDGTVAAARVLRSIPLLDRAALDAVRQWQYVPTSLSGVPQAVLMTVTVNFTLQ